VVDEVEPPCPDEPAVPTDPVDTLVDPEPDVEEVDDVDALDDPVGPVTPVFPVDPAVPPLVVAWFDGVLSEPQALVPITARKAKRTRSAACRRCKETSFGGPAPRCLMAVRQAS
jgi:hypothetical protein